ncbi:MAG: site-2 protease family protein [Myxococcota bacterium]
MASPPSIAAEPAAPLRWRGPLLLFVATVVSVFVTGARFEEPEQGATWLLVHAHLGWAFAVPLIAILATHEAGHYVAARIHRVPASLPWFIPVPLLSPFGTMGAVINMRSRIRSRNALLDIGAAGPIAGMVVALPVLVWGLMLSEVRPIEGHGLMEGQCLLYVALKHGVLGAIPEGHDVYLHPTAFAGWTGLFLTMINMLPVLQLDGGHIAYALFGDRQTQIGRAVHYSLPVWFLFNYVRYGEAAPGMPWLVWFALLMLMRRAAGGVEHPPFDPGETLSPGRRAVAVGTLIMFALLFMPTPLRAY